MEDLFKDDPNSWLRRANFSRTVYHRPDPSQLPIIPLREFKQGSSNSNSNWAATSMPSGSTTMSTVNLNPDSGFTGKVQGGSDSKSNKTGMTSKRWAISEMLKEVNETVRRRFVAPPPRERTGVKAVKSSSRAKKENRWIWKCFDCGVHQVNAREKSSEVH